MVIQSARFEPRERLCVIAGALRPARRLLDTSGEIRAILRAGSRRFYLAAVASEDPACAWLRTLSPIDQLDVSISEER